MSDAKKQHICLKCLSVGVPARKLNVISVAAIVGTVGLEITFYEKVSAQIGESRAIAIGLVLFGIIASIATTTLSSRACARCRNEDIVPLDSPRGQQALVQSKTPPSS